jgi:hypothetical protein
MSPGVFLFFKPFLWRFIRHSSYNVWREVRDDFTSVLKKQRFARAFSSSRSSRATQRAR